MAEDMEETLVMNENDGEERTAKSEAEMDIRLQKFVEPVHNMTITDVLCPQLENVLHLGELRTVRFLVGASIPVMVPTVVVV